MKIYDGKSSINWFYDGLMTYDQMRSDQRKRLVTEVPCVLMDDGQGSVYSYRTVESVCREAGVEYTGDAETDMEAVEDRWNNPGPSAEQMASEAKSVADEAKTTADTAAASVDEYMDALLGLDTTDETEATDAE